MEKETFILSIKKLFPKVSGIFFEKIEIYKGILQKYNSIHNLTRLADDKLIYSDYFLNSLIPFQNVDLENKKLLDIGSGSGIPGIALKLLCPSMNLTIIESNKKKVNFLYDLCDALNIKITIYLKRAEEIRNNEREQYDIVTSRAVSELKNILEISVPYCKVNGLIIEPKGRDYEQELNNSLNIIKKLDIELKEINVVNTSITIATLIFIKNKITDLDFPRS
jgi:16S rRNA (guanine527-N7)-methyltransferase